MIFSSFFGVDIYSSWKQFSSLPLEHFLLIVGFALFTKFIFEEYIYISICLVLVVICMRLQKFKTNQLSFGMQNELLLEMQLESNFTNLITNIFKQIFQVDAVNLILRR